MDFVIQNGSLTGIRVASMSSGTLFESEFDGIGKLQDEYKPLTKTADGVYTFVMPEYFLS